MKPAKKRVSAPKMRFSRVGLALGALLLLSKKRKKHTPAELHRSDFKSSTQRMGVHFPDSLRQKLRFSWLKLRK